MNRQYACDKELFYDTSYIQYRLRVALGKTNNENANFISFLFTRESAVYIVFESATKSLMDFTFSIVDMPKTAFSNSAANLLMSCNHMTINTIFK